ncbi:MAG: type II toxin-antitoxin system RelE/ParE family toxin [Tepidiformaceae bacterium]
MLSELHAWSPPAARHARLRITGIVESLRYFPELGREIAGTASRVGHRRVVVGVYLMAYQVFPDRIRIVSVIDGRRAAPGEDDGDEDEQY